MPMTEWTMHTCPRLEESYYESRHPSGLTVLVSPKDFSTFHATVGVRYGSADRHAGAARLPMGVAHFLEHKMFARVGGSYDDDFATLGAEVNAYTTYDRTVYMVSCTRHMSEALELLLRMVSELSVTPRSVARERGIIAEEIRMNADDPWERCYAEMLRALYGRHPVREEICGSEASIRRITPRMLLGAFEDFYRPDNMVLAVSGRMMPEEVMAAVDRIWSGKSRPRRPLSESRMVQEPGTAASERTTARMAVSKPLFAMGVKLPLVPDDPVEQLRLDLSMTVLSEMLFSHAGELYNGLFECGMISPGMSYGSSLGPGFGYFAASGECDDPEAVYAAIRAHMDRLHAVGLAPADFERARRILYADYVTGFDSTEDIAASLCGYALDSLHAPEARCIGLYDFLDVTDSLTFDEVAHLFSDAFCEGQYSLSAVLSPVEADTIHTQERINT